MDDREIIQLYWERNDGAIPATAEKYGNYCASIAGNILGNPEDAKECVNDTYLRAWNAIPPHRPDSLPTFLGRITRNLSLNRFKHLTAEKRGGGQTPLVLDELSDCISGRDDVEQQFTRRELIGAINGFLAELPPEKRRVFLWRYWYFDSVSEIAARLGATENSVSVTLHRLRVKLRGYLSERGFDL